MQLNQKIASVTFHLSTATFQDSSVGTSGQEGLIIGAQTSDKCLTNTWANPKILPTGQNFWDVLQLL